jgi:chaperonin GroES
MKTIPGPETTPWRRELLRGGTAADIVILSTTHAILSRRVNLARKPPRLQHFLFDLHPVLSASGESAWARRHVERSQEHRMNLQPLGDRLIVEVLEEEESTASGIVLPDTAKEKPQRARILAVGPGARNENGKRVGMDLAKDDEVIFSKYGGSEIKLGADDVLILRESDVLAKVTRQTSKSKGKRELASSTA